MVNSSEVAADLLAMIACPACRAGLVTVDAASLRCTGCARVYPIVDGIPFLIAGAASRES